MWKFRSKKNLLNTPLRILLVTNSLVLLAGGMIGPIYALFVEDIGGSILDASFAGAMFALAAGVTTFISGKYADHNKHKEKIVVFGYLVMGAGFMLYTLVNSIFTLMIVQVIIGFGEAIYLPAFDAVYSKHLDHNKEGQQWGAWESVYYFATAIGAAVGGYIVVYSGFNLMFILMALLCLGSALYIYRLPKKAI
ncbi:MFS transporter [Patescibacteria group bacterium]